jgi:hypothetical protein
MGECWWVMVTGETDRKRWSPHARSSRRDFARMSKAKATRAADARETASDFILSPPRVAKKQLPATVTPAGREGILYEGRLRSRLRRAKGTASLFDRSVRWEHMPDSCSGL